MIAGISLFLILVSGSLFSAVFWGKRFEKTIPVFLLSLVMIMYLWGACSHLLWGVYSIVAASVLLYVIAIIKCLKIGISSLRTFFLTKPLVLFSCFYFAVFILNRGMQPHIIDEMSHWGYVVKSMTFHDALITRTHEELLSNQYPPGVAVFQYFICRWIMLCRGTEVFPAGAAYAALQLLAFSFVFPLIRKSNTIGIFDMILTSVVVFLVPLFFYPQTYNSLYVDSAVGISMGTGIAMIVLFDKEDKDLFYDVLILMGCAFLSLSKRTGIVMAVALAAVYFADTHNRTSMKVVKQKAFGWTVGGVGLAFVPWLYWQIERTVDNRIREQIHTTVEMPGMIGMDYSEQPRSIVSLFRMAISGDLGYRKWIPRKFVERFFEAHYMLGETGIQISYVVFIICMVITLYFVFMGENDNIEKGMKQFKKTIIYISIVLACWFGFYLCAYMFMMNRFEGSLLASFERYISTGLMVPGYVFVFGLYFFVSRQKESLKKVTVPLYIALLCIFLPLSEAVYFIDGHNKEEAIKEWETVQELCDKADKLQFGIEDKILFVSQEDTGEKQWWINYHIYPTKIQRGPWRFHDEAQAVSAERAYSSSTITASELRDYLAEKGVTYVMIHKTDEYFIKAFGELFASGVKIEENTIYLFDSSNRLLVRAL